MSYCRFSSDNWKSDIYCYEACSGGFTTHVAGNHIVSELPEAIPIGEDGWLDRDRDIMESLGTAKRETIGLEHDGANFNDPDLQSFKERIEMLKAAGYHIPEYVIPSIEEEITEELGL